MFVVLNYVAFKNDKIDIKFAYQYMQFCDNVLLLDGGEILEAGRHEELMNGGGRYAQLISRYQLEQSTVRGRPSSVRSSCLICVIMFKMLYRYRYVCVATITTSDIHLYCWQLKIVWLMILH